MEVYLTYDVQDREEMEHKTNPSQQKRIISRYGDLLKRLAKE